MEAEAAAELEAEEGEEAVEGEEAGGRGRRRACWAEGESPAADEPASPQRAKSTSDAPTAPAGARAFARLARGGARQPGRASTQRTRHNIGWLVRRRAGCRATAARSAGSSPGRLAEVRVDERRARAAEARDVHERVGPIDRRGGLVLQGPARGGRRRSRRRRPRGRPTAGREAAAVWPATTGCVSIADAMGIARLLAAPHRGRTTRPRRSATRLRLVLSAVPSEADVGSMVDRAAADAVEAVALEGLEAAQREFN